MQVDLAARTDLVWGVDRVERDGDAVRFLRMPAPLQEHYSDTEARRVRMGCTAGVRVALRTDSPRVRLAVEYGDAGRRLYEIDVFVDGEGTDAVGATDDSTAPWEGDVLHAEAPELRDIVIWLTHCSETRVRRLELADGCAVEPLEQPAKTWLAMGDSITQGMTCKTPSQTFSALVAARLGPGLRNVGVGGRGTTRARAWRTTATSFAESRPTIHQCASSKARTWCRTARRSLWTAYTPTTRA